MRALSSGEPDVDARDAREIFESDLDMDGEVGEVPQALSAICRPGAFGNESMRMGSGTEIGNASMRMDCGAESDLDMDGEVWELMCWAGERMGEVGMEHMDTGESTCMDTGAGSEGEVSAIRWTRESTCMDTGDDAERARESIALIFVPGEVVDESDEPSDDRLECRDDARECRDDGDDGNISITSQSASAVVTDTEASHRVSQYIEWKHESRVE